MARAGAVGYCTPAPGCLVISSSASGQSLLCKVLGDPWVGRGCWLAHLSVTLSCDTTLDVCHLCDLSICFLLSI